MSTRSIFLILFILAIITLGGILLIGRDENSLVVTYIIAILLVIGVLVASSILYGLFNDFGDSKHALGLPQGSIRAFIALSLIISFGIISIFLFESTKNNETQITLSKVKPREIKAVLSNIPPGNLISVDTIYRDSSFTRGPDSLLITIDTLVLDGFRVHKLITVNEDAKDLAKQILTILATLVVAVSSFYFGSKATEQGSRIAKETFGFGSGNGNVQEAPSEMIVPGDIVEAFYDQNKRLLKEKYKEEIIGIGLGKKETKGVKQLVDCIVFIVKAKDEYKEEIPDHFTYTHSDGKQYKIPTDIREEGTVSSSVSDRIQPGNLIKRAKSKGTVGLIVKKRVNGKEVHCILSCYHVLCGPEMKEGNYVFNENTKHDKTVLLNDQPIGQVHKGHINKSIDGALAVIETDFNPKADHIYSAPRIGIKKIKKEDADKSIRLYMAGGVSINSFGDVDSHRMDVKLEHNGDVFELEDIIVTSRMSTKGDSGAVVFDKKGMVVGLLVADGKTRSYVQPISRLINELNFEIEYA